MCVGGVRTGVSREGHGEGARCEEEKTVLG